MDLELYYQVLIKFNLRNASSGDLLRLDCSTVCAMCDLGSKASSCFRFFVDLRSTFVTSVSVSAHVSGSDKRL